MSTVHPAPQFRPFVAVALTLITVVSLAACSSSASPSGGGVTTVTIQGRSFGDDITVPVGTTVVFHNADGFTHTVTNGTSGVAVADPLFDMEVPAGTDSDPIVFDALGTYDVTCRIHTSMHLKITVE